MAEEYVVPLTELLEAGSHFGHQVRRWNPKMAPYIYAERDGVHIFDLAKTAEGLKKSSSMGRPGTRSMIRNEGPNRPG